MCNSFDLVRVHKFGDLDREASENQIGKNLPSYKKMVEFASNCSKVKKLIHLERLDSAKQDFDNFNMEETEENTDWLEGLEVDRSGKTLSSIDNVKRILLNDINLKGKIKLNEFSGAWAVLPTIPWNKDKIEREWKNSDDSNLRHSLEKVYKIKGGNIIDDELKISAEEEVYHPVREYLNSLSWIM